jgi:undecaprenyl-diphosphatase
LLHGPTELLPISSSGHTALVPWLARWPYPELSPELRKSFEVCLHAGTALALLVRPPSGDRPHTHGESHPAPARPWSCHVSSPLAIERPCLIPALGLPALCGYALGGQIERRFGTPATIAASLLAGSAAMGAVEICARKDLVCARARKASPGPAGPSRSSRPATRDLASVGALDGLTLGFAQSLALIPGISRSGATITAARVRGFSNEDADRLSWRVGLPVIAGAALLKGAQLARTGVPRGLRLPLAAGAASAFASTLTSVTALGLAQRATLTPASIVYRSALALLAIRRMRDNTT